MGLGEVSPGRGRDTKVKEGREVKGSKGKEEMKVREAKGQSSILALLVPTSSPHCKPRVITSYINRNSTFRLVTMSLLE